ncbi:helicase HerA domain-containing protein [Lapillicoccus sp.]|uniref:ATP-binding protein n=1 Tax=Lapillicoccus sp. TaxID=1909287 RepID=UPI003264E05A
MARSQQLPAVTPPERALLTDRLDYRQQVSPVADLRAASSFTAADPVSRALLHVRRVGKTSKGVEREPQGGAWFESGPRSSAQLGRRERASGASGAPLLEAFAGLHGRGYPLVMLLQSDGQRLGFHLGCWSAHHRGATVAASRVSVLQALLQGTYPVVVGETPVEPEALRFTRGGYATGIPALRSLREDERVAPLDRIVRGMRGRTWRVLVLAQPLPENVRAQQRNHLLNELRMVVHMGQAEGGTSPLADHYADLAAAHLASFMDGGVVGMWRTACYLRGDNDSYPMLASLWRGTFGSVSDTPEPVQVFETPDVPSLSEQWAMPDIPAASGPGFYSRLFAAQAVMSSEQLGVYVHLPERETPGFGLDLIPDFDSDLPIRAGASVGIGAVLAHGSPTGSTYAVTPTSLTRHALVAGLTGSGKTNTTFQLLSQLHAAGVPFLVLEPAKTEYRALLRGELAGAVRVYTLGSERVAPLRMNPFELQPGVSVTAHVDLIRAVFTASFSMWPPLPQVFERCLQEIYVDRGWDLATGVNTRAQDQGRIPPPTLTDLANKVRDIVPLLGYSADTRDEIQAALLTRINGLRGGAKGRMLDVDRSQSIADLLAQPTIMELEALGDDDDKAFVMGMLLVHLYERRRQESLTDQLRHVLVVEEAHRLLTQVEGGQGKDANPKAKFVEAFTQILSEIRAYGQGVLIADQVPVRLAPDVVKNTDLKIIHRLVAQDDREAVAAAMAMTKTQTTSLATLRTGQAVVFSEGDDAPVLVQVPRRKTGDDTSIPSDNEVAELMGTNSVGGGQDSRTTTACDETCDQFPAACGWARVAVDEPVLRDQLRQVVHTALVEPETLPRLWHEVADYLRATRPAHLSEAAVAVTVARHGAYATAQREAARSGWPYDLTETYALLVADFMVAAASAQAPAAVAGATRARDDERLRSVLRRTSDWYPRCTDICGTTECAYRTVVRDVRVLRADSAPWGSPLGDEDDVADRYEAALQAADLVVVTDHADLEDGSRLQAEHRKAALCYAQQQMTGTGRRPQYVNEDLTRLLERGKQPFTAAFEDNRDIDDVDDVMDDVDDVMDDDNDESNEDDQNDEDGTGPRALLLEAEDALEHGLLDRAEALYGALTVTDLFPAGHLGLAKVADGRGDPAVEYLFQKAFAWGADPQACAAALARAAAARGDQPTAQAWQLVAASHQEPALPSDLHH